MKNFNKPNYIPEQYLKVTKNGWADSRTNEILVSVRNLDEKLEDERQKYLVQEIYDNADKLATLEQNSVIILDPEVADAILNATSEDEIKEPEIKEPEIKEAEIDESKENLEIVTETAEDVTENVIEEKPLNTEVKADIVPAQKRSRGRPSKK